NRNAELLFNHRTKAFHEVVVAFFISCLEKYIHGVEISLVVRFLKKLLQRTPILLLIYQQLFPGMPPTLYNIELTSAGLLFWIHRVALPGRGERTPFVNVF